MRKKLIATALLVAAPLAGADTLTISLGYTVDGKVKMRDDGSYEVDSGGNINIFRPEEVLKVEPNDKDGSLNWEEVEAQAKAERDRMDQLSGLTQEQRDRVDSLLNQLYTGEGTERLQARENLVKMNQDEVSVVKYLYYWFDQLITPALLEAIYYVNPGQSVAALEKGVKHANHECRAKGIDLLAQMGHAESADLIARGLADHALDVQLSATYALAKLGIKDASGALVELMAKPDVKLGNASREALGVLWKDALGDKAAPQTVSEWEQFLKDQKFSGSISLAALEPLILPEQEFVIG